MIDAKAGGGAASNQLEHETVDFLEHRRIFHAQRRELVDVEEAAVVDLFGRDAPVREPVRLGVEQRIETIERSRLAGDAVEASQAGLQERVHRRAAGRERRETALDHFLLARAQPNRVGVARASWRQVLAGCQNALELVAGVASVRFQPGFELVAQDHAVGVGRHRQAIVVMPDHERAVRIRQLQFLPLEHGAVLVAEDRNQHLVRELVLHGMPFDVEEAREARARTILEDVLPPRVRRLRDPHVVRHDVQHVSHPVRSERVDPAPVVVVGAQVRVQTGRVDDVVAMRAARDRSKVRRRVTIADTKLIQVRSDRRRLCERKLGIEL